LEHSPRDAPILLGVPGAPSGTRSERKESVMHFFQRFVHLARADAHGVLDSLEDRGLLLRQCLREAELEVARKRGRRDELDAALEILGRQHEQVIARGRQLDEDVKLALGRGEEELARFAIRRLLALRKQSDRLEQERRTHREEREKLAAKLDEQEQALDALRDRVRQALAEVRAEERPADDPDTTAASVRDEEIELELLRRRAAEREVQA
jgi:phage shock protein A